MGRKTEKELRGKAAKTKVKKIDTSSLFATFTLESPAIKAIKEARKHPHEVEILDLPFVLRALMQKKSFLAKLNDDDKKLIEEFIKIKKEPRLLPEDYLKISPGIQALLANPSSSGSFRDLTLEDWARIYDKLFRYPELYSEWRKERLEALPGNSDVRDQLDHERDLRDIVRAPYIAHGEKMQTGRKKGAIGFFPRLLDNIITDLGKENKKTDWRTVFNKLHNNEILENNKNIYSINPSTKLIHLRGKRKPMAEGTFKNQVTCSKIRLGISPPKK
jgi:hypothetical protein